MVNVKGYISSNFTKAFLTIFLPFFLIMSLGYIVQMSSLTAKIQITFGELVRLYTYSIPDIIFYTLPLSFVAALANVLMKLSQENELIALYALGLKSNTVLRSLLFLGVLFSLLLTSISFLAMPLSIQFFKSFTETKRSEAKLNIVAGKLGQKFGDYYIYIKEKENNTLHDIIIYTRTNRNEEQFFSSKKGKLNKVEDTTSLLLDDGYVYTYTELKLQQAKYKTLELYDTSKKRNFQFEDIIKYWSKAKNDINTMHKVLFFIFVSLIPFLSVYPIASFTMINPRYQRNHSFIVIFVITLLFYIAASYLQKQGSPITLLFFIITVLFLGKWLFEKRVSKYF